MKSQTVWKVAAVGAAAFWLTQGVRWLRGMQGLPAIHHDAPGAPDTHGNYARLAVIVPACNEADAVEEGITSILGQASDAMLVVAVDDRSADGTGAALDRLAASDPRLSVVHVHNLPAGWLGKNHALHQGARRAAALLGSDRRNAYLLFTDADVVYQPGTLSAALRHTVDNDLDHLTLVPHMDVRTFGENVFIAAFMFVFAIAYRMWEVNDPRSDAYIGAGAFNMVRAEAYDRIGGHERLRMDVADDLRLGALLRRSGARQQVAMGTRALTVRWQHSLNGLVRGLEKNAFAGVHYSVPRLIWGTAGLALLCLPYAGIILARGWPRLAFAAALAVYAGLFRESERQNGPDWRYFTTLPAGVTLFVWAMWRSAVLCLLRGGIVWRGTFYPLEDLREWERQLGGRMREVEPSALSATPITDFEAMEQQ
ncbi:MAG TPA: glycosyltransferase [Armatimonadota bacterium]|jgi:glycosyltransferase involved in cell wall biosynthesis